MVENNEFWNVEEEEISTLSPFYAWGKKPCRILLEKAINEYEIVEIESQYGISCYIELKIWSIVEAEFEIMKLKVDSKRLRKVLLDASKLKFPAVIDITRDGSGFNTTYKFEEVKAPHQSKLDEKKKK